MAQQTAVEWLFEQLTSTWYDTNSSQDIFKQAKEMEKEQILQAWDDGNYQYFCSKITNEDFENGYEYYDEKYNNETYNK